MPANITMNAGRAVLDRGFELRDRLLSSAKFQRWAARSPFARFMANKESRALFDLCAGFVYSQVLLAAVRLRLFEILSEGAKELPELQRRLDLPDHAARRLLDACVALRLASKRGHDRYGLGVLGAALNGNPGVKDMIEHHAMLYADLHDPVAMLRGENKDTRLARYWPYASAKDPAALAAAETADYTKLMSASLPFVAEEVLDAYDIAQHACLMDVGGGEGLFLIAAGERAPNLKLKLFDLPAVASRAAANFAAAGVSARAEVHTGNFHADSLPKGADVISLVRVLLDHGDEAVLALLKAVRQALPPNGTLLIAEGLAGTPGMERMGDAYFGMYLMAMGHGRPRSDCELQNLLQQAGFQPPKALRTRRPLLASVIIAQPK